MVLIYDSNSLFIDDIQKIRDKNLYWYTFIQDYDTSVKVSFTIGYSLGYVSYNYTLNSILHLQDNNFSNK